MWPFKSRNKKLDFDPEWKKILQEERRQYAKAGEKIKELYEKYPKGFKLKIAGHEYVLYRFFVEGHPTNLKATLVGENLIDVSIEFFENMVNKK